MHHDDIRTRRRQPAGQLFLRNDAGGQDTAVAFVGSVIGESAPLSRQGTHKLGVGDTSSLELLPENGTPAPLGLLAANTEVDHDGANKEAHRTTGDGISESHDTDLARRLRRDGCDQGEHHAEEGEQRAGVCHIGTEAPGKKRR